MAKLQDCQFIEFKIKDKAVKGSSEEAKYKGWMEGYSAVGLSTAAGPDGVYFYASNMSIAVTKETSDLYSKYLMRGYSDVTITIVHRGSDKYNTDYEIQRSVYQNCKVQSLNFVMRETMYMDIDFIFEGSVELTLNVPNADETGLDKIGPIKYDIPQKKIL